MLNLTMDLVVHKYRINVIGNLEHLECWLWEKSGRAITAKFSKKEFPNASAKQDKQDKTRSYLLHSTRWGLRGLDEGTVVFVYICWSMKREMEQFSSVGDCPFSCHYKIVFQNCIHTSILAFQEVWQWSRGFYFAVTHCVVREIIFVSLFSHIYFSEQQCFF